jgi:hypothetical protein
VEIGQLLPEPRTHPLKWAIPDAYEQLATPKLLKQLTRLHKRQRFASSEIIPALRQWLDDAVDREPDCLLAVECLAWAQAASRLSLLVSEQLWRELLDHLDLICEAAGGIPLDEQPVVHQLLNGELPLALAYLFPEIDRYARLRESAAAALSFGLVELTDGEGLVGAGHVREFRQLLACWTRCSIMASAAGWSCLSAEARTQFEWSVRQTLRLSRSDGSAIFTSGLSGDWCADLLHWSIEAGGDASDKKIASVMFPGARGKLSDRQLRKLPKPSVYSEWAELCVMRPRWSRKGPQFSCLFADRRIQTELSLGGRVIWSGDTDPTLRVGGRERAIVSEWAELCWFSDEDVDYLELEADFEGGWKVQRQLLLARRDDFLLMSDVVIGKEEAEINYQSSLPLASDVVYLPEEATREGYLKDSRPLCTVLPLALPEWRSEPSSGELVLEGQQLVQRVEATACRLYAPLFFDLASRRWVEKRTWRRLTVAERLEIQPREVAVGYRVQLGRKQWLIYRSLAPSGNRTVLGQNLSEEFVVGRFDTDGSLAELIEIE